MHARMCTHTHTRTHVQDTMFCIYTHFDLLVDQHPIIDVIWFMDDLNDFYLDACLLGALARMKSHHPASHVHIIVKEQLPNKIPDFVRLLSATLHHGDDASLAGLAAAIPVWRGRLLLHHNQVVVSLMPYREG